MLMIGDDVDNDDDDNEVDIGDDDNDDNVCKHHWVVLLYS